MKKLFTKNFGITKIKNAKRILTFRTFLVILAGGMIFTACKKENNEMPAKQDQLHSWKTSEWVMKKSSIIVEGILCDEYQNQLTGQVVYEGLDENKQITYDKTPYFIDDFGHLDCRAPGHTCYKAIIGEDHVLIIKVGASVN